MDYAKHSSVWGKILYPIWHIVCGLFSFFVASVTGLVLVFIALTFDKSNRENVPTEEELIPMYPTKDIEGDLLVQNHKAEGDFTNELADVSNEIVTEDNLDLAEEP